MPKAKGKTNKSSTPDQPAVPGLDPKDVAAFKAALDGDGEEDEEHIVDDLPSPVPAPVTDEVPERHVPVAVERPTMKRRPQTVDLSSKIEKVWRDQPTPIENQK